MNEKSRKKFEDTEFLGFSGPGRQPFKREGGTGSKKKKKKKKKNLFEGDLLGKNTD